MDELQKKKYHQINEQTLETDTYNEFLIKKKFMSPHDLTEKYVPNYYENERTENIENGLVDEFEDSVPTYKNSMAGNDSIIQQHSLEHYIEVKNNKEQANKYNALASSENVTADKLAENSRSGRKASSRRSKFKEAAKHSKMAEEYRTAYIMNTEFDEGEQTVTFETAVNGLKFLEENLKASRYAAEAKSYSKEHELYRKAKAEVKIRGAQIALIDKLLNSQNIKPEELDKVTDYLNGQKKAIEEKYEKYSKEMSKYSLKLGLEQDAFIYSTKNDREIIESKIEKYATGRYATKEQSLKREKDGASNSIKLCKDKLDKATKINNPGMIKDYTNKLKSATDNLPVVQKAYDTYQNKFKEAKKETADRLDWIASVSKKNSNIGVDAQTNGNEELIELTDKVEKYIEVQKTEFIGGDGDFIVALGNYLECREAFDEYLNKHAEDKKMLADLDKEIKSREGYLKKSLERISLEDSDFIQKTEFEDWKFPATYTEYKKSLYVRRYETNHEIVDRMNNYKDRYEHNVVLNDEFFKKANKDFHKSERDGRVCQPFGLLAINDKGEFDDSETIEIANHYIDFVSGTEEVRLNAYDKIVERYTSKLENVLKYTLEKVGIKLSDNPDPDISNITDAMVLQNLELFATLSKMLAPAATLQEFEIVAPKTFDTWSDSEEKLVEAKAKNKETLDKLDYLFAVANHVCMPYASFVMIHGVDYNKVQSQPNDLFLLDEKEKNDNAHLKGMLMGLKNSYEKGMKNYKSMHKE